MKSILHKHFKTDRNLETEGITLRYEDPDDPTAKPVEIRIARAGGANTAYEKELDKKTRPIRRQLAGNAVSLHEIKRITREVYAQTVLLGWSGVTDDEGKPMAFNYENAVKMLEELPDLFDDIQQQAQQAQLFRGAQLEDDAKN